MVAACVFAPCQVHAEQARLQMVSEMNKKLGANVSRFELDSLRKQVDSSHVWVLAGLSCRDACDGDAMRCDAMAMRDAMRWR